MTYPDDPFGLQEDRGRTRVRQPPPSGRPRPPRGSSEPVAVTPRDHPNALIGAFAALLAFAPELESAMAPSDPETLRTRLLDGLISARDGAVARGVTLARADAAAWAVAALLDDLALNTPWSGSSAWPSQPLVSTLYGDVDAGTRFFERLEELERYPSRDPDMLQLYVYCLELGFRGKYRVPGRAGASSLAAVRTAAARLLRDPEAAAAPLSPNWQGVVAADTPRRFAVPVWVLFVAAVAACAGLYLMLSLRLAGQADALGALARALPPAERAEIYRPPRDSRPVAPTPGTETVAFSLLPEFSAAAPEGLRPALKGSETVSLVTLVVQWSKPELFQSARAELTDGFEPLIDSIGKVLGDNQELIGDVTVVGHTDSVQVSSSNPFRNNQGLSEARAAAVARLLVAGGAPADRVHARGRAASDPVASNDTREGRALNRRVEILVEKRL
jgi:type VI secretion system protein ImpK